MQNLNNNKHWDEYKKILNFMKQDGLFTNSKVNERMYAGDQWFHLSKKNQLPKIVLNFIKRVINYLVSAVNSVEIKINYSSQVADVDMKLERYDKAAELFTAYAETAFENMKQSDLNERMIKDSYLAGLGLIHYYFDNDIVSGNDVIVKGEVVGEIVDATNFFPSDPTLVSIQKQKRIHISYREDIEAVKKAAKENGLSVEEIAQIVPDKDTQDIAFDKAQIEVEGSNKVTVLLTYEKKDGFVFMTKSVSTIDFVPEINTNKTLYPIIGMNSELRKNSIYGTSPITEMIPNQIYVNTLYSMAMVSAQKTAYPKIFFDSSRIAGVTNAVGGVFGVKGSTDGVFKYGTTGQISTDVYNLTDNVIAKTKDNEGANDTLLGNIKPENTSAILANQQQSNVPLESIQRRYYSAMEDLGRILEEFWKVNYNINRPIKITNKFGEEVTEMFNGEDFADIKFNTKVDVGASSQYSEIVAINTLNAWVEAGYITFGQLLERFPKKIVPKLQELIDINNGQQQMGQGLGMGQQMLQQGIPPQGVI